MSQCRAHCNVYKVAADLAGVIPVKLQCELEEGHRFDPGHQVTIPDEDWAGEDRGKLYQFPDAHPRTALITQPTRSAWTLICDACADGRECKAIGVAREPPFHCAGCGAILPLHPNGLVNGNAWPQSEIVRLRFELAAAGKPHTGAVVIDEHSDGTVVVRWVGGK